MNFTVFIPTRGRYGIEHVTINEMRQLAPEIPFHIVCPPDDAVKYRWQYRNVLECPAEGIGPTRQWILENSPTDGVVMLDDDMYFSEREPVDRVIPLVRTKQLWPMFDWIGCQLDAGYAHGGISARQGNQHVPTPTKEITRVNNAHFFDRRVLAREEIRFDAIPVMEDFYVTLSLLLRGYRNIVAYHYCWSQRGSGAKGGCSSYRTAKMQEEAAYRLHELFPDFVRVVMKESRSGKGVFKGDRYDVHIQWKKAWEARRA